MTDSPAKKSDLGVRTLSAIVMLAVAGGALWLGGIWLDLFIAAVALVTFGEFFTLVMKATRSLAVRIPAVLAGAAYIGIATWLLIQINSLPLLLLIIGAVVAIDIGAYAAGRSIGGPKIAPSISPSKTWAGLGGAILGALLAIIAYFVMSGATVSPSTLLRNAVELLPYAILLAVLAQAGDFFESWLKRRAGVKDSSNLIPGHGGFFDRIDGLLPVVILVGTTLVQFAPHWLNR
jgi:phosphatidate cytidylyltransferase